ncbi:MAG: GC-type dockerin domain-anchored protein [Phycisphaerales bacterium JB037]
MRTRAIRPIAIALAAGAATTAHAQVDIEWANPAGGLWNTATNWSPMDVPDTLGENALINLAGSYTVQMGASNSINNLLIGNTGATLQIDRAFTLTINGGTIANNGLITMNPQNSASDAVLAIALGATLSGTGEIHMKSASNNTRIEGPGELVQSADHAIRGVGQINGPMDNAGVVSADAAVAAFGNLLVIQGSNKTNSGLFSAAASSNLTLSFVTLDQTASGVVRALDDGVVNIQSTSINGGAVDTDGTGVVNITVGASVFDGTTNTGLIEMLPAATLLIDPGGLVNNGTISMNLSGSSSNAQLRATVPTTISGNGEVLMRANFDNANISADGGASFVHEAPHQIRGVGQINAPMTNNSEIWADAGVSSVGSVLQLIVSNKVNNNLMGARTGSTLSIESIEIDQTGGGALEADGGLVRLINATIRGGQFKNTVNGGTLETAGGISALENVVLDGNSVINFANTIQVLGAGVTNNGVMTMNPQNSSSDAVLDFPSGGNLAGNGEIRMGSVLNNTRIEAGNGFQIVHGANHAIRGVGEINGAMVNNGQVHADAAAAVAGNLLDLRLHDKVNNGFFVADPASRLRIVGIVVDQTGGGMLMAEDTGRVELSNATVVGGIIDSAGSGYVENSAGSSTLRSVMLNAPLTIQPASTVFVEGAGLMNNNIIVVNPSNSSSDSVLQFSESGDLAGTGSVHLGSVFGNARVETSPGQVITQGPDHSIRGVGNVRAGLINDGIVAADLSARGASGNIFLDIEGEPKINRGTFAALPGTQLRIIGCTITQTGAGEILADDGVAIFSNATIDGGVIRSLVGGNVQIDGDTTMRDVELLAPTSVNFARTLTLQDALTNGTTIVVNPTNSSSDVFIRIDNPLTISGAGEIRLTGIFGNSQIVSTNGSAVTLGQSQIVSGVGSINSNTILQGTIRPGLDGVGSLIMDGSMTIDAPGEIEIEIEGTNLSQFDRFTGGGTWNLGGTLRVIPDASYTPTIGDTFSIITGSSITGRFDDIIVPLPQVEAAWRVAYLPNEVRLILSCAPDFTGSSDPNDPSYGIPDGDSDADDFFYLLDAFVTGNTEVCDLTGSSDPNDPTFRIPNGVCDADDFFFFLDRFVGGCP